MFKLFSHTHILHSWRGFAGMELEAHRFPTSIRRLSERLAPGDQRNAEEPPLLIAR